MEEKVWKRTFRQDKRITLKQLNMFMTNSLKRVQEREIWKRTQRPKFLLRNINIHASNKKVLFGKILEVGKILSSVWTSNILLMV